MNFLQLVNRTRVECGVSGAVLTTLQGPLSAESARIRDWVNSAWVEIQAMHEDWLFQRVPIAFQAQPGRGDYALAETGAPAGRAITQYKRDSFRAASAGQNLADEQLLTFQDWDTFRNLYRYGSMRATRARPVAVTIQPDKTLSLGATPDAAYDIVGEAYLAPLELAADADTPAMPVQFHLAIVYLAMQSYAGYEAAPEVLERGVAGYRKTIRRLEADQLRTLTYGPPLA